MHTEKTETESVPYVAWQIVQDMLQSFTDDQLLVMDRLVRAERRERFRRPDPDQAWLFNGRALQRKASR